MTDTDDPTPDAVPARQAAPSPRVAHPALARWAPRLAWVVVALVLANVVALAVGHSMSEPLRFSRPVAQIKDDQLRELTADGSCIDIVALGDSLPGFGIDPEVLMAAYPGLRAYNAAMPGSQASMTEDWTRRFVVPVADPSTVLLGVSSLSFAPGTQLATAELHDWSRALETRTGVLAEADRMASGVVPLVRYRGRLTDPEEWGRFLTGKPPYDLFRDAYPYTPDDIRAAWGQVRDEARFDPTTPEGQRRAVGTSTLLMPGWSLDDEQLAAFRTNLAELRDAGRTTAVVLFPVTQLYVDAHPGGPADYRRALDTVRTIASEEGIPVIDLSTLALPPGDFVDTHHLNAEGARRVTEALVEELARQGVTVKPCQGAR